ncbi:hypothetical protein N0V88_005806 [Collariella sp. IMI 366227]|nr:hypothetical protein N0V88_005806 [Collariella sp. IMI 366227]
MPSGEVAEAVLAACALASGGILRGFTRYAFPYTDLTKVDDLLKVPGFIAGRPPITEGLVYFQQQNPTYANLVHHSSSSNSSSSDLTGDAAFMADIQRSIATRAGERVIRAKWRAWVLKFTRIAAAFEESVYGASALYIGNEEEEASIAGAHGHGYVWVDEATKAKELAGNVTRIEGWRNTRSYYSFIQDVAQLYTLRPLKGLDLAHLHDRLRTQRLTPAQSKDIYDTLARYVRSYDDICLLLSVAPESTAGLFYVALGLFHKDKGVRFKTAELLERVADHEAGQHWWRALSRFEKLAFGRIVKEREAEGIKARAEEEGEG